MTYKILVVDDDQQMQRDLAAALRPEGYHVTEALDAIAAMVMVRRANPDLVILELGLRAGDGFTVLEQLRSHRPADPIPAIVLTTRDPDTHRQRALDAGAAGFLTKPPDVPALVAAIREHVGKPRPALRKVLVVEDDPDTQKGLGVLLTAAGFLTTFTSDAATALSVAVREQPSVVLLDLGLPAGDGFMVLERLKRHPTLGVVPVVVVSARAAEVNRPKALAAGADAFLQKPADFDELLASIRKAVGDP